MSTPTLAGLAAAVAGRLRDGAVIDDIEITDGHPVDETIRRVSQLG
jgi:hypothetical protein